jgi:hypothetical protein
LYAGGTITEKAAETPLPVSRGYSISLAALQNEQLKRPQDQADKTNIGLCHLQH